MASKPLRQDVHDPVWSALHSHPMTKSSAKRIKRTLALHAWLDSPVQTIHTAHDVKDILASTGAMTPPCTPPGLGMTQDRVFHDPGAPPLPNEAQSAPVIDPLTQYFAQASPLKAVAVSPALCLHAPAAGVPPTPLASLVQCLMRPATLPKAVRASVAVLRVQRFQQEQDEP